MRLNDLEKNLANFISEHSYIAQTADLGEGIVIFQESVVGANATIGNDTIINSLSSLDHDCMLDNSSQITAGLTLRGNTNVASLSIYSVFPFEEKLNSNYYLLITDRGSF